MARITFFVLLLACTHISLAQTAESAYIKGIRNMDQHRYNDAIADFTAALNKNDRFADAYLKRGSCLVILNDYPNALFDLDKAVQLDPKNSLAYYNRGLVKKQGAEYQDAVEDFSSAIELNKEFGLAYFNRALCQLSLGTFEVACQDLSTAADLGVTNAAEIYQYTCKKP